MNIRMLFSWLAIGTATLGAQTTLAQTLPSSDRVPQADNTLGTQVTGTNDTFTVTGGLSRGQTLFHSFTDFSIPTGGTANFTNPSGTTNIITRVTGNLFSDINGTLNSNGANFLLINPNGIVFGANARLNVGSTFAASTANGVDLFGSNGQRYSFATNASGDTPLLTVNPNVSFDISRLNLGASPTGNPGIINFGTLQTTNDRQYIGLIGGDVTLIGGQIIAPGGRVDLGGLTSAGTVSFDDRGLNFGNNTVTRSDVTFINGASVSVRADKPLGAVNIFTSNVPVLGSNVNIQANNVTFANAPTAPNIAIDAGLETNSGIQTQPAGDINIDATGRVDLDNAIVRNSTRSGTIGQLGDVKVTANTINLNNGSLIATTIAGRGNGGNIQIVTTGDINISGSTPQTTAAIDPVSTIVSTLNGEGELGKISIDTQNRGKLVLTNNASIRSGNFLGSVGKSSDITISATAIDLSNGSEIFSSNFGGTGNAGNISIVTAGDINISGGLSGSTAPLTPDSRRSSISSDTFGLGDPGKITISTQNVGKLSLANNTTISSEIYPDAIGNSQGIKIVAREIELKNRSSIASNNLGGSGNAGDIEIKTVGDVRISNSSNDPLNPTISDADLSTISSLTQGQGNAGKITIDTSNIGKVSLVNRALVNNTIGPTAIGNGNDITISARAIDLEDGSKIEASNTGGFGNAGNIQITTIGDIRIVGFTSPSNTSLTPNSNKLSGVASNTSGTGNSGKISIDTQNRGKVSLTNRGFIASGQGETSVGDSKGISISASSIDLQNNSIILSNNIGGKGNAGNIDLKTTGAIELSGKSGLASTNLGVGTTGNITISSSSIFLNDSTIEAQSLGASGGNIRVNNTDRLLLRNSSTIATNSGSGSRNGNGGNITISSPFIIALPGNNDISANAFAGTGGNINIFSQGLLGIAFAPIGTSFSDITASSTFGVSGTVSIDTPGIDPGKDSVELPNVPTDASTQIDRACNASNRVNKFAVTGRGGLPPDANDPLTSDVVWQDSDGVSGRPGVAPAIATPAPPAVGWVFDGKGNVTLIASGSSGQSIGTGASCPQSLAEPLLRRIGK